MDYDARVWINGVEAGRHQGGYVSFTFNITKLVKEGENDITLFAADDVRGGKQPKGKQSHFFNSRGCDYTRTTGIWQTVWLEWVPESYIEKVQYYPNLAEATLGIKAVVKGQGTLEAKAFMGRALWQRKRKVRGRHRYHDTSFVPSGKVGAGSWQTV